MWLDICFTWLFDFVLDFTWHASANGIWADVTVTSEQNYKWDFLLWLCFLSYSCPSPWDIYPRKCFSASSLEVEASLAQADCVRTMKKCCSLPTAIMWHKLRWIFLPSVDPGCWGPFAAAKLTDTRTILGCNNVYICNMSGGRSYIQKLAE